MIYSRAVASRKDALLGRIAVERGLITNDQLKACMMEQQVAPADPNKTVGPGGATRPLGALLLSKGLLQEKQLLELLEEQDRRLKSLDAFQRMQKVEYLFGQLLVKHDHATQLQINKCLEIQQKRAEMGLLPIPRLGELLVEHGFVDKNTVAEVLKMQNKDLLFCTGCGRQYNVVGVEPGKTYRCKECNGVMMQRSLLESLRAEETSFGFELPTEEA